MSKLLYHVIWILDQTIISRDVIQFCIIPHIRKYSDDLFKFQTHICTKSQYLTYSHLCKYVFDNLPRRKLRNARNYMIGLLCFKGSLSTVRQLRNDRKLHKIEDGIYTRFIYRYLDNLYNDDQILIEKILKIPQILIDKLTIFLIESTIKELGNNNASWTEVNDYNLTMECVATNFCFMTWVHYHSSYITINDQMMNEYFGERRYISH